VVLTWTKRQWFVWTDNIKAKFSTWITKFYLKVFSHSDFFCSMICSRRFPICSENHLYKKSSQFSIRFASCLVCSVLPMICAGMHTQSTSMSCLVFWSFLFLSFRASTFLTDGIIHCFFIACSSENAIYAFCGLVGLMSQLLYDYVYIVELRVLIWFG
jgi:hypothetical protein